MEHGKEDLASLSQFCEWCGSTGTSRCSRCQTTYYCSKQHQINHWPVHQIDCRKPLLPTVPVTTCINQPSTSSACFSSAEYRDRTNLASPSVETNNPSSLSLADENKGASENVSLARSCSTLNDTCMNVMKDLNDRGICVLDEFMGPDTANVIFKEVGNLYRKGIFQKGQLVNPKPGDSDESIRSDVITWVNGSEPECEYLQRFLEKIDVVICTCNTMPNNDCLSRHKLYKRTKAMVACYPGNGTHYKKHVDNPHKDGRCITCVYYLNPNWDIKKHGGLLRVFSSSGSIFDIEPMFDRVVLFWSDKRNPHEVLPAFHTRFAITVWYLDSDERTKALQRPTETSSVSQERSP